MKIVNRTLRLTTFTRSSILVGGLIATFFLGACTPGTFDGNDATDGNDAADGGNAVDSGDTVDAGSTPYTIIPGLYVPGSRAASPLCWFCGGQG